MVLERRPRVSLRRLLDERDLLVAPGVWDGVSAKIAERLAYDVVLTPGWGVAAALGMPDADVYSKADNVAAVRVVAEATSAAVVADIDGGYGSPMNVVYSMRAFEAAGASAVLLEDQVSPKRCDYLVPHLELHDIRTAANKVRAAVESRRSQDTLVIARTDAAGDEILRRGEAYAEAGADLICPIAVSESFGADQWRKLHEVTDLPLMAAFVPGYWQEQRFDAATLVDVGVRLVTLGLHPLYAATRALMDSMRALREGAWVAEAFPDIMTHDEFGDIIGMTDVFALERRYTTTDT
jgi:methylisocitrate lyase